MKHLTSIIIILLLTFLSASNFCQKTESTTKRIEDTFEHGRTIFQTGPDWKIESGRMEFSKNKIETEYYPDGTEEEIYLEGTTAYNLLPEEYSDFTVSVETEFLRGDLYPFGITFGNRSKHGYSFMIYADNIYTLVEWIITDLGVPLIENTYSNLITSIDNILKVTCIGTNIKCYINGKKIIDIKDNDLTGGRIGLIATTGVFCAFDDFRIGPPEEDVDKISLRESFAGKYPVFSSNENWKVKDSQLHFSTDKHELGFYRYVVDANVRDFFISVKTKCTGEIKNNGYGLLFGLSEKVYYTFLIAQDGHYKLSKWNGSEWINIIEWTETDQVKPDFNLLRVNCSEQKLECYINDTKVIDNLYTEFNGGEVGIYCSGGIQAAFDDFVLSPPKYIIIQTEEEKKQPKVRGKGKS
jgi:hypothetical protein